MIGRLTGTVAHEEADGTLVLDVHGVGYEVTTPLGTTGRVRAAGAADVTLYIHTHVREDALQLFGFASADERLAFRTLLGISSVGPKIALAILSVLPAPDLARVVARKEIARLTGVPGVGKKTAERLLLELRDKFTFAPSVGGSMSAASGPAPTSAGPGPRDLLLSALTRMGYKPAEAERAIDELGDRVGSEPLGDLVREALRFLSP
jgi:Holliday junction DNA helicase RuvA